MRRGLELAALGPVVGDHARVGDDQERRGVHDDEVVLRPDDVEQFLEPDSEILVAKDGAEVAALVDALTPERSRRIGDAARRRMLDAHTYGHRAAEVESLLLSGTPASRVFA